MTADSKQLQKQLSVFKAVEIRKLLPIQDCASLLHFAVNKEPVGTSSKASIFHARLQQNHHLKQFDSFKISDLPSQDFQWKSGAILEYFPRVEDLNNKSKQSVHNLIRRLLPIFQNMVCLFIKNCKY